MSSTDHRAVTDAGQQSPGLRLTTEWQPGDAVAVMTVSGNVTTDNSRMLDHFLRTKVPAECHDLVVDLRAVRVMGPLGARVLMEHGRRLASSGQRMLAVTQNPETRRTLQRLDIARSVHCHDSMAAALEATRTDGVDPLPVQQPQNGDVPAEKPAEAVAPDEIHKLRAALRVRPVVGRALGVLQERYGLTNVDDSFELLHQSAHDHNLTLHAMAKALLSAPRPRGTPWFPDRIRRPAPSLSFVSQSRKDKGNRTAVLTLLAEAAADYLRSPMVTVHLVDPADGAVWLELDRNLPPAVVDGVAGHGDPAGVPVKAAAGQTRVVVPDITTEVDPAVGDLLRSAGVHALQSTPLMTSDGGCLGVVTTYHTRTGHTPAKLQCAKLDHAATETADWLDWHQRTVVLDALESLHKQASARVR